MAAAPSTLALPAAGRSQPRNTPTFGLLVLLLGASMLIGGLIAVFEALAFTTQLPPKGARLDEYLGVVSSLTLLLGSVTAAWGLTSVRAHERRHAIAAMLATLLFGLAQLSLAWTLLAKAGFGVASSPFATLFYALIGTATAFVAIAAVLVAGSIAKIAGNQINALDSEALRAVVWYWHFTTAAWIAVTLAIYPIVKL